MKIISSIVLVVICVGLVIISCHKEYSCENCIPNHPPVADAGPDQSITLPLDSITVNGSQSHDVDGQITSYQWTRISGNLASIIKNPNAVSTIIKSLVAGTYTFQLKVTDNKGASAKDTMRVTVYNAAANPHPPIALAGADQTITLPVNKVALDGSASHDPDNDIVNFNWTHISGPSGFLLSSPASAQTQALNLERGIHLFQLRVTDATNLFSLDTVKITVNAVTVNHPPVADAGSDQCTQLPVNTITLDGSLSSDPDSNITTYRWTKISGPPSFTIVTPDSVQTQVTNLTVGSYVFGLKVTDAGGLSSTSTVNVNLLDAVTVGSVLFFSGVFGCNDICADGDVYWESAICTNSFLSNPNANIRVEIRLDTAAAWIRVVHELVTPRPNQFYWHIDRGALWIFAYQGRLIGTPLTIRITFL